MSEKKFHPISSNVTIAILVHIAVMCAALSFVTYRIYSQSLYSRYRTQMKSIVDYVEQHIDDDDMSECANTYVESPNYKETHDFFDDFIDHYSDIHYLYILKAFDPSESIPIRSICSANSTYEKENEPENVLHLGDGEPDWYDFETAQKFKDIQDGDKDVYFLEPSAWGVDYTLARPLIDSKGEHYGVLCVDISLDEMQNTLRKSLFVSIGLILLFGAAFMLILLIWLRKNVITPIKKLEDSVKDYADSSSGKTRPEELVFVPPDIKVNNEIKTLSESVFKMSVNMIDYVRNNAISEKKVEGLKGYVNKINDVAYCDPLTHVKNRAAYDEKCESLNSDIFNLMAQFAIVMADVNFLKKINDEYGHDKGNEYIKGACGILSDIYKRSPLFRIGGDEFVVVLEGKDYRNRDELIKIAREEFRKASEDSEAEPWQRYSAAIGMSSYVSGEDEDVETVFKRADEDMYAAKVSMKAQR